MSFLTSLLSDIDPSVAAKSSAPSVKPAQTAKTPKPAHSQAAGLNGTDPAQSVKRKADNDVNAGPTKVQRKDSPNTLDRANGSSRPPTISNVAKPKPPPSSVNPLPYRGTASSATPNANSSKIISRAAPLGTNATSIASRPVEKPQPTTITAPSTTAPAGPRPGSYAAMMAKAKEAQQARAAAPIIKHKPTETLTKKERLALQAEAKGKRFPDKDRKLGLNGHSKGLDGAQAKFGDSGKQKSRAADLNYQGTMRPKVSVEPSYQGTMRRSNSSSAPARKSIYPNERTTSYDRSRSTSLTAKAKPAKEKGARYAGNYSEADFDEDDEEDDYDSDGSSVMEGGIWDMEQEERKALALAKKEDEEALKEENELKRQKAERRKKLEMMNAAAAKKRKF